MHAIHVVRGTTATSYVAFPAVAAGSRVGIAFYRAYDARVKGSTWHMW